MDWTFERSEAPEFIRVIGGGLFSTDGFTRMFDALFSLEYWYYRVPLFFDVRELDFAEATPLQLLAASNHFIGRNIELSYTRIAVLFKEDDIEMARRFGMVTMPSSKARAHPFVREEEAIEWITNQQLRPGELNPLR
jgi:hypothetical protein